MGDWQRRSASRALVQPPTRRTVPRGLTAMGAMSHYSTASSVAPRRPRPHLDAASPRGVKINRDRQAPSRRQALGQLLQQVASWTATARGGEPGAETRRCRQLWSRNRQSPHHRHCDLRRPILRSVGRISLAIDTRAVATLNVRLSMAFLHARALPVMSERRARPRGLASETRQP